MAEAKIVGELMTVEDSVLPNKNGSEQKVHPEHAVIRNLTTRGHITSASVGSMGHNLQSNVN